MERLITLIVKVVKVPYGPAPEKFRKAWVGLNLLAKGDPFPYEGPEYDFVANQPLNQRKALLVPVDCALERLREKSPKAAAWFSANYPPEKEYFTFGMDEVEIIKKLPLSISIYLGLRNNFPRDFERFSYDLIEKSDFSNIGKGKLYLTPDFIEALKKEMGESQVQQLLQEASNIADIKLVINPEETISDN